MMTDPSVWSPISLGRWGGTHVRVHIFLVLYALYQVLHAAYEPPHAVAPTLAWLGLLLLALAVHELAHALTARSLGCEHDEIRVWPLGDLSSATQVTTNRPFESILIAVAGPAVNLLMVVGSWTFLYYGLHAYPVLSPFGNDGSGVPFLWTGKLAPAYTPAWGLGWFAYFNYLLFLTNLIPALPFDGGKVLRARLLHVSTTSTRESPGPGLVARSCVILLVVAGLLRFLISGRGDGLVFVGLAVLIEWMRWVEAQAMEEGGFFEDGVFGYDFSEGYTSLESSAAKVRPYRESALKRWRRRRSDLRRQRRQARELAEDRRMDEILEKLHREGRSSLSDEEHRFLVRVSAKFRNKPHAGD